MFWGTGGLKEEGYWTSSAYPIHEEDQEPFEKSCFRALEEMILINRNHPSVIIWSVSNEPFFTDKAVMNQTKNLVKKLVNRVHELDPSRKAAVEAHRGTDLMCLEMWRDIMGMGRAFILTRDFLVLYLNMAVCMDIVREHSLLIFVMV